ncbi:MAG: EAL domain-containing protein [Gammaproteobacteria bacterium]|nr:EAL domain-containing protein [Gammaproteobacteria bacterium]
MSGNLTTLAKVLVDCINCGVLVVDLKHCVLMVNQWLLDKSPLQRHQIIDAKLDVLVNFSMPTELSQAIEQAIIEGRTTTLPYSKQPTIFRLFIKNRDHSQLFEHQCHVTPVVIDGQQLAVIQITDVSAAVTQQHHLLQSNSLLRQFTLAAYASPNTIIITDGQGTIEYVNKKFSEISGYAATEAIGQSYLTLCCNQENSQMLGLIKQRLSRASTWQGERVNQRKSGELYWFKEKLSPIVDHSASISHFVITQEDITEVHTISQQVTYQASHDLLTGMINRQEFERILTSLVESAKLASHQHVLFFLDLDQFKIVNDTCGHAVGDELLRQISTRLLTLLSCDDTLARIGGDEFAIILRYKSISQATAFAQELIEFVKKFRFRWEQHVFTLGVSIGITAITAQTTNSADIIIQADSACYAAKDAGRNRYHVYHADDQMLVQRKGDTYWVTQINDALEHNRFVLYAQPIVPILTDEKISFEVLVRLKQASGKLIAPGVFLPPAERYNLSHRIDEWVIGHTLDWLDAHADEIDHIDHISINLSGQTLCNEVLLAHLQKVLTLSTINPKKLAFEITETAAIANLDYAQYFIDTLRGYGCKFLLDDFGSGLSSFAYLKNLHVDILKIDGMFVKNILNDPIDEAMVRSINDVGHVIGMKTVAEFVENDQIKQRLIEIGIDYGQGYGLGKPEPIDYILSHRRVAT